jgi:hypothetical protein
MPSRRLNSPGEAFDGASASAESAGAEQEERIMRKTEV